jgi:hypothetical protein
MNNLKFTSFFLIKLISISIIRLQHLAQKRAQLCSIENNDILMRQQPGYGVVIGQNLAAGYDTWPDVLKSWMSESDNFVYKSSPPSRGENFSAGHYTQVLIK